VLQGSHEYKIQIAIDDKDEETFLKLISQNREKINSSINVVYLYYLTFSMMILLLYVPLKAVGHGQ
jgi:hypothetical protein